MGGSTLLGRRCPRCNSFVKQGLERCPVCGYYLSEGNMKQRQTKIGNFEIGSIVS